MTKDEKEQIAGEIDNEGFDYWLQNFSSRSLKEQNAPQNVIDAAEKACKALDEAEALFEKEGLIYN